MTSRVDGYLAEFEDVTSLVRACEKVRDAGYERWDSYSPFPVHGIDPAMGIRPTRIPWAIFAAGITGTLTAIVLQWWTNAVDYPWRISGKPYWSIPANVPIAFELTVLFAAVTAFLLTLAVNGLPSPYSPLFKSQRFKRATDDRFFISISARDEAFDAEATRALLEEAGAVAVESIEDDEKGPEGKLPAPLIWIGVVGAAFTLVPLAFIAKARTGTSPHPRVHVFFDMDSQPKFKTQTVNTLYPDGRAMRKPVDGTVATGELSVDEHFARGVADDGSWAETLPPQVPLTAATLDLGQERFNIYCTPCHGSAGYGDGLVHKRALQIGATKWAPPTSLHEDYVRQQQPGKIFDTITHGIRSMPGYGHAIPESDRWAIVAYVRALQLSQRTDVENVPAEERLRLD